MLLAAACLACASRQRISLAVTPAAAEVFVDGAPVEGPAPRELELRSDRAHVLFFKLEGYQAERVVLRSVFEDGDTRLEPGQLRVELEPLSGKGRQVEVELE